MKVSFVVLSVATLLAHTVFAQSSSSISAESVSSAVPTVSAQSEQTVPVHLESGEIDFSKIDPHELETIYQEIEEDALLEELVNSGWPSDQAQLVLSLTDIVESLMQVPEEDENNEELVSSLAAVGETLRDLLASVGFDFRNTADTNASTFSRMVTTKQAYSEKAVASLVAGLVNLMKAASRVTAMLGSPSISQYGMMISSAIQMIETLVGTAKGLLSPDYPTVDIAPQ